ncbi:hypothetical protein V2S66_16345 [Streptomyces sp. V4-01]|uniref:Lipoprotein n=1 Tax=Actinacidiphila polyblastidii TaxID=3110430 RepID=A0ABU7PCY1_9ACTN|nr:hypothetical protein [Streptomyces sp. V4-01]
MREKCSRSGRNAAAAGAAALVLSGVAGCAVGQGAPDGWRYQRHGPIAVALPKTWRATPGGAVLPGPRGRTDAALTVAAAARPAADSAPAADSGPDAVPADARRQTLTIDGRTARVSSYAGPAPDGRPAGHVEVRLRDGAGRPLTVRAWAVDGAGHDRTLLAEIVNGIELPARAAS